MNDNNVLHDATLRQEEVIAQQVFAVSRLTPVMMLACGVNALCTLFVFFVSDELTWAVFGWSVFVFLLVVFFLVGWWRNRHRSFPKRLKDHTRRKLALFSFLFGLIWAVPGLFFLPGATGVTQAFLVALAAGMISGGAISLYPVPNAAFAFCGSIAVASLIGFLLTNDPAFWGFAFVTACFFVVVVKSIVRHKEIFVSEFRGRRELAEKNALIEKLLEETRSEAREQQREAEEKLAQAQRIEAVGRLTAGVAHDFNNLLAVIMGNVELASELQEDKATGQLLSQALKASHQGADLTQKLLAFGRKARLDPQVVAPGDVIEEMTDLIRRTLPATIEIDVAADDDLAPIEVDRSQLDSALLNLALNARDAMPDGGRMCIDLRNVQLDHPKSGPVDGDLPPGDYVCISVADTGTGIEQHNIDLVFEPFFTTKSVGKGSGLGLSMVYGFAKQSGGHAEVHSDPGKGARVDLWFPAVQPVVPQVQPAPKPPTRNFEAERILLVEDCEDVRAVVRTQLQKLGLDVTEAETADEAVTLLRSDAPFDLMLSDVVMPGDMQGHDLAQFVLSQAPKTGIVLMSGYVRGAIDADLPPRVQWLSKPTRKADLAEALRNAQAYC